MPSEFFERSTIWVVDFRYDGRALRWFQAFGPGVDAHGAMQTKLCDLYGTRAQVVQVRPATLDEATQYLRDEQPKDSFCPSGRRANPVGPD